ncbi:PilZ domain-containing protein [Candidatus Electrothrix sp.]|uniref:PilZ domain-containing protein n=1 Tax=Candidatus Electrothrix sp. TaxID=2170559 RepID=UPI00405788C8
MQEQDYYFGRRSNERIGVQGYHAVITDDNFTYKAGVRDVSLGGIRLLNISKEFFVRRKVYDAEISGEHDEKVYHIRIWPVWKVEHNNDKFEIGFIISNFSTEWQDFVENVTAKKVPI